MLRLEILQTIDVPPLIFLQRNLEAVQKRDRARQAGWSLEEIAVYAGHQTKDGAPAIATTVRYTLPSRQRLKERIQMLPG